jgi:chemotaxis protein histidine kinase CheA
MTESADPVQSALAKLKERYRTDLPMKVARLTEQVATFLGSPWEQDLSFTTYRMMHSLAGSAGTYGYSELGIIARGAEAILKESLESKSPLTDPRKADLNAALQQLKDKAAAPG